MKPRSSRVTEADINVAALRLENELLKNKISEQNKYLEGLRSKNTEFAKSAEANNVTIRTQNEQISMLNKDFLICKANYLRLKHEIGRIEPLPKLLIDMSNIIKGTLIKSDLTLGKEDFDSSDLPSPLPVATTSKANVGMKVLPTISGHTIQKPTISISKSDSQKVNSIIQHQNDNIEEMSANLSNSMYNNFNKTSADNSNEAIISNTNGDNSSGEVESNENVDSIDDIENDDETIRNNRLSTVLEMSLDATNTNKVHILSNNVVRAADISENSVASSTHTGSFNRSKKRQSILPSPITSSIKIPRILQTSSQSSCNQSAMKKRVSSIGMSTRGSSIGLSSAVMSYDPLEGPSTLLDQDSKISIPDNKMTNDFKGFPLTTSTPMDTERTSKSNSRNTITTISNFVTTRKTKSQPKNVPECRGQLNFSKSLENLSGLGDPTIENVRTPVRRTRGRKLSSSLTDLSAENGLALDKTTTNEEMTSKRISLNRPKKGAKFIKSSQRLSRNRQSRSYSPNYRRENNNNNNKESAEIPVVDKSSEDQRIATDISIVDKTTENVPQKPIKRCTRSRKKHSTSSVDLSPEIELVQKDKSPFLEDRVPKKIPRGRPRKEAKLVNFPIPQLNRKSRSYSPNYRTDNNNKQSADVPTEVTNPTVQLERLQLLQPGPSGRKKRRSRSVSPAHSEQSAKSESSEHSTRSSKRGKVIVNYNEPSLKSKVRRK